ncbi:MAG: hypothetical protein DRP87_01025 [Spirochaetes bacterium]|nr:MAG: hypothetical protein DRP87_01025 [Spirochaetota bacterium]
MMRNRLIIVVFLLIAVVFPLFAQLEEKDALELYRKGQYEEAVKVCLQELEIMPRRMDSYVVLGWSLIRLGRYQEALEYAEKAHTISPSDYRVIEIMGEIHYFLGDNENALKCFEEYTVLAPTGDRIDMVYYFMGEIFIRLAEYNHADIAFSTALYHSPNRAEWWARLGYAREMAKNYNLAVESYNKALQLNSTLTEARRGKERVEKMLQGG